MARHAVGAGILLVVALAPGCGRPSGAGPGGGTGAASDRVKYISHGEEVDLAAQVKGWPGTTLIEFTAVW